MEDLIQTEARGPLEGPLRAVWVMLYTEGCPLDQIWRLFRYCTQWEDEQGEESADSAPPEIAEQRATEQVRLRFPRSGGPWPGFGCATTVKSSLIRVDTLIDVWPDATRFAYARELLRVWRVLSPAARAAVGATAALSAGLARSIELADATSGTPFLEHGLDEGFDPVTVARWMHAVSDLIEAGALMHDLAGDRYLSPQELATAPTGAPPARRASLDPPDRGVSENALAIVATYNAETPLDEWRRRKLADDPLSWIEAARNVILREEASAED